MKATTDGFVGRLARGAVGGLAGTVALQGLRMASERFLPESLPPMNDTPDHYVVSEAERRLPPSIAKSISPLAEKIAGQSLAVGYGMMAGTLCSVLGWRRLPNLLRGAGLGLTTWAIGYLGWLPRTGVMPSVRKQTPAQVAGPIVRHMLYGIVSVEVAELVRWALRPRAANPRRPIRNRRRVPH